MGKHRTSDDAGKGSQSTREQSKTTIRDETSEGYRVGNPQRHERMPEGGFDVQREGH